MKVFILTEGGRGIGFGHITRCASLYQAFKEKGITPEFIINGDNSISNLLKNIKHKILKWDKDEKKVFKIIGMADIIIVDSYLADISFYNKISDSVKTPAYIDDTKRLDYPRGVVINGTIGAEKIGYPIKKDITYLLGIEYAPSRKTFWTVPNKRVRKNVKNMLITFGGNDLRDMTPKILDFLNRAYPKLIKNVVITRGFKNRKNIEGLKSKNIFIIYSPSDGRMKALMMGSDIAISASGQTLYELARVGVPTIALMVAENQVNNMKGWQEAGFIEDIGWWEEPTLLSNLSNAIKIMFSYKTRIERRDIGRSLVDGKGARRIVEFLLN